MAKIAEREELYYKKLPRIDKYLLNGDDIYLKKNPSFSKNRRSPKSDEHTDCMPCQLTNLISVRKTVDDK